MRYKKKFLEILRIISAMGVVLIHTTADLSFKYGQISNLQWWASNLISAATHWAVPMFIMISGYLLLSPEKSQDCRKFYLSRISRLGIPLLISVIFYAIYHHFTRHDPLTFSFVINRLIFDQPYEHLYFLIVLLQLSILSPFISKIIKPLTTRKIGWLTIGLLFISVFWKPQRFIIPLFIPYLGYYLGGYWLRKRKFSLKNPYFFLTIISLVFLIAAGTYLLVSNSSPDINGLYFYTYFNPLTIILSFVIFIYFQQNEKKLPANKFSSQLSATTMGIYLIHPIILSLIDFTPQGERFLSTFFLLLLRGIIVFFISSIVIAIYQRLKLVILRM